MKKGDFVKLNQKAFEYGNAYTFETHKKVLNHVNAGNKPLEIVMVMNVDYPYLLMIGGYPVNFKEKELKKVLTNN